MSNLVIVFLACVKAGFVQVLKNLEYHGILVFHFPGLESHGI